MNRPLTDFGVHALRGRDLAREMAALSGDDLREVPRLHPREAIRQAKVALDRSPPALTDAVAASRQRAEKEGRLRCGLMRAILLLAMGLLVALWLVPVAAEGIGAMVEVGIEAQGFAG